MSRAKSMLYLLNVNWDWIKQRPQYLAEALAEFYCIDVYEKFAFNKSCLTRNSVNSVHLHSFFRFPLERCSLIHRINDAMYKIQLKSIIEKYKYIWVADVNYFKLIKPYITRSQCIIYDCMDDVVEFPQYTCNEKLKAKYLKDEFELINSSSVVFTSANHLKNVLAKRHPAIDVKKIHVVNNAVSDPLLNRYRGKNSLLAKTKSLNKNKVITYIGTISQWINWGLILKSLKSFDNIEYHFMAPLIVLYPVMREFSIKVYCRRIKLQTPCKHQIFWSCHFMLIL